MSVTISLRLAAVQGRKSPCQAQAITTVRSGSNWAAANSHYPNLHITDARSDRNRTRLLHAAV